MDTREKLEAMALASLAVLAMCIVLPLVVLVFLISLLWHEPRLWVAMALAFLLATAIAVAARCGAAGGLAVCSFCFFAAGVVWIVVKGIIEHPWGVEDERKSPPTSSSPAE